MRTRRRDLIRALQWTLGALVILAVAFALGRNWAQVSGHLRDVGLRALLAGFGFSMLPPVFSMFGWRVLLADLGSPIARGPAAGMFFVGQLGKYVPGSVWSIVVQAEIGARLRIPRRRTAVVGLIAIGLAATTALLVGIPALPLAIGPSDHAAAMWTVLGVIVVAGVVLSPPVLNALVALVLRLLRRDPLEHRLSGRAVVLTSTWFLLAWAAAGAQTYVVARDLAPPGDRTHLLLVSVCGFALASGVGMFSVIFPAGVGVRDGAVVLILATVMPTSAATAVAVLLRFLSTTADVLWAVIGWAWARSQHLVSTPAELRREGVEPTDDPDLLAEELEGHDHT